MEKCSLCGYCEIACPTFLNFRDIVFAPRWRVQGVALLKKREVDVSDRIIKSLFTCLSCASCIEKCPLNLNIPEIVIEGRNIIPKPPQNEIVLRNIIRYKNPFGFRNSLKLKETKRGNETLVFIGCIYPNISFMEMLLSIAKKLNDKIFRLLDLASKLKLSNFIKIFQSKKDFERIRKILSLLRILGYEFTVFEKEPCCGEILYNMGYLKEFREYIAQNYELFKEHGIKRIIALSPFCAYAFKKLYPRYINDWDIEVLSLAETINLKFKGGKMTARVTYHDPCYYSRHLKITEEIREIFRKIEGLKLIEAEHSKENSLCVGDGGLELYYPSIAYNVAKRRVEELISTKADTIATQCPACIAMIELILKEEGKRGFKVKDLGEIVFDSLKFMH